jgi:hypothetical protein
VRDSCTAARHLTVGAANQPPPPCVAHAPHCPMLIPSSYHAAAQSHFPSSPLASPLPLAGTQAAITTVPRPPSTATPGAPPTPSTPPVASPELEVALHPHQSRQPTPVDHLTGVPLRPTAHRHGEPPAAIRPKSKPPSPRATPRLFPRRPTTTGRPNSAGEPPASGGGGFPSPVSSAGLKHRGNQAV